MPDILIIPQRGTSNNPSMHFTGSSAANIKMEVLPAGGIAYIGTSGSLFNITDNLVGSLMSVGDVSGLPILEVFSDDRVVMGKYNANTLYVSGTRVGVGKAPTNAILDITGSVAVTGSLAVTSTSDSAIVSRGGALFGPNTTWSKYLLIGGDGRQNYTDNGSVASVCTTNGNLHIDAASGFETYINWYDGSTLRVGAGDSSTTRLAINSSGNVGIGTGSPSYKIHAYAAGQCEVAVETASRKWGILTNTSWASNGFSIYDLTADASRLNINTSGDVGIGTTSPSAKLHVSGDVMADNVLSPFLLMGA